MFKYPITFLILVFLSIMVLFVGVGQQIGQKFNYVPSLALQLFTNTDASVKNILILGLDKRDDWLEKTNTTDTIILANLQVGKVNLLSLPRDLWDYSLNTKINQIYPLSIGQINNFQFIQNNFEQISGQKIDRTVVITTDNLVKLCQLIGGIDVYNEIAVKDKLYPNPEYINHPDKNTPIYITVDYPAGLIHLNASNITPFIRSRHGAQTATAGGTDLGRIQRQQAVFDALFKKLSDPKLFTDLPTLFSLYRFWNKDIQTNLTDFDLGLVAKYQYRYLNQFKINKITIPAGENPKTDLIYHPISFINNQWVFIPQQPDYVSLQQFIQQSFYGTN